MLPGNNYQYISTGTTSVVGSASYRRINCKGIFVNKTLTGTMTIKAGATTIGAFAIGTVPGSYWLTDEGMEIADMQVVTTAADDITIAYNNL